ncbi:HK97-gp10 family putative phage morphogenesis protein [Tundrisphaera sp. TA3]|uniref:HK97-gp10 family putative phage morphogenesis protein n=1 Tax=Tundrisphaera sp. TA3 TaxID=3435775 RepID=UPI003EBBDF9A
MGLGINVLENRQMSSFSSLGHLAAHFAEIALKQHEMEHHALEKVGKLVEKRAKAKIGEYQDEAGPFIAWPELADFTKEDRLRQGFSENDPLLRTGAMRDSIGHQVAGSEVHVGSNSDIAVYQELGTSKIPPRSFLGGAAVDETKRIREIIGEEAVASLVGEKVFGGKMKIDV